MLKRGFDILTSAVGLLFLSPLFVIVALIVRLSSPGPVFYRAKRAGRGGTEFTLYKFRSMVVDADQQGPGITVAGDPRVTPFGRVLRRSKLDELPQLFNVLRGDMSFVGPRPEDPRYVAFYTSEQRKALAMRPGITSLASLRYRNEEAVLTGEDWENRYINEVLPAKLTIDLEYAQNANLWRDIGIILRTLFL